MKKLEIIIESVERRKVCRLLDQLNVSGYTIIDNVLGRGSHFTRSGSELSDIMKNSLIIVIESDEVISKVIDVMKNEVLNFYSGKLFLSDVEVID
jgi:nitrogen regulatory protein PII